MAKFTWNAENTAQLQTIANAIEGTILQSHLPAIVEEMDGPTQRAVSSKLRSLNYTVQKADEAKVPAWSVDETEGLVDFVTSNEGAYTYAEFAAQYLGGKFSTKQVQGKLLSLELTDKVKPTPKAEAVSAKTYSDDEEAVFIEMANADASIEAIADKLGRSIAQVRGKALSLMGQERIAGIPKTANSVAKASVGIFDGIDVETMTVAEIAEAKGKTERGIKGALSRQGLNCQDYKGADRKAKAEAKKAKAADAE